jgi:hypothetical protein
MVVNLSIQTLRQVTLGLALNADPQPKEFPFFAEHPGRLGALAASVDVVL